MDPNQIVELNSISNIDLVCFSHLRWDFVYQRPQHLMTRFGKQSRVFFIEEPILHNAADSYNARQVKDNIWVITPRLNELYNGGLTEIQRQKKILNQMFKQNQIGGFIAWYYTPIALKISSHLTPELIVYDCMDELSAFKFAPAELKIMETELFSKAQVVFTGGHSLYEAKRNAHHNIYPFPSSIEKHHFSQGRNRCIEPAIQQAIPPLKFGFYGVIDERFNIQLVKAVAEKRPHWQIVLIGPVVKINPADLPRLENIHYLGPKTYDELPAYLAGWDFAMIPFEKNESTKFISPTKTPEYLAAGKPVISTSITDVVSPYGNDRLVYIADDADAFIAAAETELVKSPEEKTNWLKRVDKFLENISWDYTSGQMMEKIKGCLLTSNVSVQNGNLKSVA